MTASLVTADTVVARSGSAVAAEVDGQLVALDVEQGVCYGLNRIATRVWDLIEPAASANTAADVLLGEFAVDRETCVTQVVQLLTDLHGAGLVKIVDA